MIMLEFEAVPETIGMISKSLFSKVFFTIFLHSLNENIVTIRQGFYVMPLQLHLIPVVQYQKLCQFQLKFFFIHYQFLFYLLILKLFLPFLIVTIDLIFFVLISNTTNVFLPL